ncbi:beta-glucuronosyltransferase GlcAT14B-like isoform X2 [Abrus precatorius]|uniref:Beta-glucuronosyltransferase GlcAT14B-like isoform X2 n=1 Tax=Abrus precatorius TaxID=3816 RepID=A0A8B8KZ46_ABRPR|nr:beta-glucuronosyltransferase GlcAT14B-like isoform X2 [Abrus precatorius]
MKKLKHYYGQQHSSSAEQRKWVFPVIATASLLSLFSLLLLVPTLTSPQAARILPFSLSTAATTTTLSSLFVESKLHSLPLPSHSPHPPILAYLISGSAGHAAALQRTLAALYHPRNRYILHLDLESSLEERRNLKRHVDGHVTFRTFGNVRMVSKANLVTYRGPTMVANTLHAAAIALTEFNDWDWFINLSASDYPLVTQDGSAWMALSRSFIDYCIWGWDNLPRTVLMYYTNFISSPEGYFHTVICNAQEFRNTTVNSDLHFISWDNPPKQHPHYLGLADMKRMVDSSAPFARKFHENDPVLDKIDAELLSRGPGMVVPGGWCIGSRENGSDPCSVIGNTTVLRPGPGSKRLENLFTSLLSDENFRPKQCV